MQLLDGKKLSGDIKNEIQAEVEQLTAKGYRKPHLVAILVGENPASQTYVASKVKACNRVGFASTEMLYPPTITQEFLLRKIDSLNKDPDVDGILVQLPLPEHISENKVIEAIAPERDVDGFHPVNIGRLAKGLTATWPATPAGIIEMLVRSGIETKGKVAVIIGKSNIVGTPMGLLLSGDRPGGNATTIICDIHTTQAGLLEHFTQQADILVVATGVPGLIKADMVKEGVVVVDVGINRVPDASKKRGYRIVGDVDFEKVAQKSSFITPVPGGVGPMTIAVLLKNTLKLYKMHLEIEA